MLLLPCGKLSGTLILTRLSRLVLLSALVVPALVHGADLPEAVWQRYLRPAEQAAVAALWAAPQPADAEDATPEEQIAGARQWFEDIVARSARPLPQVQSREFAENGVAGLWLTPENADAGKVLLYLHGGGFIVGSARTGAAIAGHLAERSGISALSLDYPLAPESPFPAQLDNAEAAYRLLLEKGFDATDIVVAGDSAGGNLTLALLLRLRSEDVPMPAGACLISPWADLTHASPTHDAKSAVDTTLDRDFLEMSAFLYVGDRDRSAPAVSPVHGDLRGMPPLLIQVGSFETLLDDSLTLARNAALADVPVRLSVWPGYSHDFPLFTATLGAADRALDEAAAFFVNVLDGSLLE